MNPADLTPRPRDPWRRYRQLKHALFLLLALYAAWQVRIEMRLQDELRAEQLKLAEVRDELGSLEEDIKNLPRLQAQIKELETRRKKLRKRL